MSRPLLNYEEYKEDQWTISAWATETFGTPGGAPLVLTKKLVTRAAEEMNELVTETYFGDDGSLDKLAEEVADVMIVLDQVMTSIGRDARHEKDNKMAVNRQREWETDGRGVGQHK